MTFSLSFQFLKQVEYSLYATKPLPSILWIRCLSWVFLSWLSRDKSTLKSLLVAYTGDQCITRLMNAQSNALVRHLVHTGYVCVCVFATDRNCINEGIFNEHISSSACIYTRGRLRHCQFSKLDVPAFITKKTDQ